MKKALRIAVGTAALAAGLAVVGAAPANAQVRFRGSFPLPHGRISVNVGGPVYGGGYYDQFPIGGYVPYGYDVYEDPTYGWGFAYDDQWIACEPRGTRFVIIGAPVYYGGYRSYGYGGYRNYGYRDYRYARPYRYYSRDYGYRRWDHHRDRNWGRNDRRWDRNDRNWDGRRDGNWDRNRDGNYRRHN